jgi:uncharacterized membrane protein
MSAFGQEQPRLECRGTTTQAVGGFLGVRRQINSDNRSFLQQVSACHCIARCARCLYSPKMSPTTRRILQAVLYEVIAIAVVGPALSLAFDKPHASTFGLALVLSTIALTWNYAFNWMFERWESRQTVRGRSFARRLAHGAGFEGGLVIILLPVMSLWLEISPAAAFLANLGLLVFFFVYAIAFTWAFDRMFGLPTSAA